MSSSTNPQYVLEEWVPSQPICRESVLEKWVPDFKDWVPHRKQNRVDELAKDSFNLTRSFGDSNQNTVQVRIDDRIQGLRTEPSWPKIFQVPHYLRKLNEEAYDPRIISIGPYHRQKAHLKAMETLKVGFLKDLLQRMNKNSAQRYVEAMTGMMGMARNYYSKSFAIDDDEFLEMMVIDGCFIVELILKFSERRLLHDPFLEVAQICNNILRDVRLVENQLPFFVLWELLSKTIEDRPISVLGKSFGKTIEVPNDFISIILEMFKGRMPGLRVSETYDGNPMENVKHLVDLLRINWLPSVDFMSKYKKVKEDVPKKKEKVKEDGNWSFIRCVPKKKEKVKEDGKWSFIRSATELREAGIKFRVRKAEGGSLFDIKFENGKLYIPVLRVDDGTETLFRNIIACEQYDCSGSPKYVTEYRKVMDCLINTGKDVELLCRKGIIDNWLGSDMEVADVFNKLGSEVLLSEDNFFYAKLFKDINNYYNRPWNNRMASLRHNYFNTPWALISFLAAAFLLLLSLLQTTFTIFPRLEGARNLLYVRTEQSGSAYSIEVCEKSEVF